MSILVLSVTGCETKSRARFEARQAYVEGQQQALDQSHQPKIVTVNGPVENSIIPWTEDLTLARAIVAANYTRSRGPIVIQLTRNGQTIEIKPGALLRGEDMPLQPGDTIEVVP